jgi:hypothetical protein
MQRRAAGLVLVIIALIGVLMVNATVDRSVAGAATRMSIPAAPATGSCLARRTSGWVDVDCADPHTAETVQSWSAADVSQAGRYTTCKSAGQVYLGDRWGQSGDSPPTGGWSLPSVMSSTVLVTGPGSTLVRGWSWQACVVRPILLGAEGAGYRGRLRDVAATGVLPAELRPCFNRPGASWVVGVSCSDRHTGEVLAARQLRIFGTTTAVDTTASSPEVRAECLGIARRATAAADPTYGGRLQVVVNLHATGMGFVTSTDSPTDNSNSYVLYQASCALQTAASQVGLSASIVGLGAGALPIH